MPTESIKGWITQAQKINAPIYIRGLVNNSFKDTMQVINILAQDQNNQQDQQNQKNQIGLLIDPALFKKYSITQVPAVVVETKNLKFVKKAKKVNNSKKTKKVGAEAKAEVLKGNSIYIIYGDVNLDYALEKIHLSYIRDKTVKNDGSKSNFLLDAIKKLRTIDVSSVSTKNTKNIKSIRKKKLVRGGSNV